MISATRAIRSRRHDRARSRRTLRLGASAIALTLAATHAIAADVEISSNVQGVNLDSFVGATARVAPGVTVSEAGVRASTQAWTLTNDGTIIGLPIPLGALNAVNFSAGGTLVNNAGALIQGGATGALFGTAGPATVNNFGSIRGVSGGEGVTLRGGGTVNNFASGLIQTTSGFNALSLSGGTSRIVNNFGRIVNTQTTGFATGVLVQGGAAEINNAASGAIEASFNGVYASGSAPLTLNNAGLIESVRGPAVEMRGGGSIVNTGAIRNVGAPGDSAIFFQGAGSVTNSGVISTANGSLAIDFRGALEHTLNLDTGSQITGNVRGGTGVDNLVLLGTGTETLTRFTAFENLSMSGVDWRLGGAGAFSGGTSVAAGKLSIDGTLTTPTIDVASGATLGGAGIIVGNLANSGTVAPGNSIGFLSINGNVNFAAGASFIVELNDGGVVPGVNNDQLVVTGSTTIAGGAVHVRPANGTDTGATYSAGSTYTIISSAGGVNGAFTTVTDDFPLLDFTLGYNATNVTLTSSQVANFCIAGSSFNQCATGNGVQSLGGGPLFTSILPLNAPNALRAFDLVSGDAYASVATLLALDSRFPREAALNRMASAANDPAERGEGGVQRLGDDSALWVRGYGSWGSVSGDGNAGGMKRSTGGAFVGVDSGFGGFGRLGAFLGYGVTGFDSSTRMVEGTIKSQTIGAYGGVQYGGFGLRVGGALSVHQIDTSREIALPGFQDRLASERDGRTTQAFVEASKRFDFGDIRLEPFADLAWVRVALDEVQERGGSAALAIDKSRLSSVFSTLGVRLESRFRMGDVDAKWRMMAGWRHALRNPLAHSVNTLQGGAPFIVRGVAFDNNAFVAEAGAEFKLSNDSVLRLTYNGQFASALSDHGVRATWNVRF